MVLIDTVLSDKERIMFHMLKKAGDKGVTVPAVMDRLREKGTEVKSPHYVHVMMKYLGAKLPEHGYVVRNTSGIGRGKTALYVLEKR